MSDTGTEPPNDSGDPAVPVIAAERRLVGRARPAKVALKEYMDFNAKRREQIKSPLWFCFAPDPEKLFRWRIQLACGCISEVTTWGDKTPPHDRQWADYVNGVPLPKGQVFCLHDDAPPAPYRQISVWGARREISFPADPPEPPSWANPTVWAVMRHEEPHSSAFWTVTLSCGHVTEVPTDLDWKPEDGPATVNAARLAEMIAENDEYWASRLDAEDRQEEDHTRRMLAQGFPIPEPERSCFNCRNARNIIAYQRIGWLAPQQALVTPKVTSASRASLTRRLRQAEAEAKQLRQEIAQLGEPA